MGFAAVAGMPGGSESSVRVGGVGDPPDCIFRSICSLSPSCCK